MTRQLHGTSAPTLPEENTPKGKPRLREVPFTCRTSEAVAAPTGLLWGEAVSAQGLRPYVSLNISAAKLCAAALRSAEAVSLAGFVAAPGQRLISKTSDLGLGAK